MPAVVAAQCVLHLRGGTRARRVSAEVRSLGADGAELRVATMLPIGSTLDVEACGGRYAATVKASQPDSRGHWKVTLKLATGSWSYEMFRAAADAGMCQGSDDGAAECLRALGLGANATPTEVEAAYFAKARRLHPDRGGDAESFAELHAQYRAALKETGGQR